MMLTNVQRGKIHANINRRMRFWRQMGNGGFDELFAQIESATGEQAKFWNQIHADLMKEHPTLSPNSKVDNYRYFDKMQQMAQRRGGMPHGETTEV